MKSALTTSPLTAAVARPERDPLDTSALSRAGAAGSRRRRAISTAIAARLAITNAAMIGDRIARRSERPPHGTAAGSGAARRSAWPCAAVGEPGLQIGGGSVDAEQIAADPRRPGVAMTNPAGWMYWSSAAS